MASITQSQLLDRTLETMEDELRIPKKNAQDFVASLRAVVEEVIEEGLKVPLFKIVTINPSGVPAKPKRKVPDRDNPGEEKWADPQPAKLRVKATVGTSVKDALPDLDSPVGKRLVKEAKERQKKAAERAAAREAEEQKAARVKSQGKSSGKKSSAKKKK